MGILAWKREFGDKYPLHLMTSFPIHQFKIDWDWFLLGLGVCLNWYLWIINPPLALMIGSGRSSAAVNVDHLAAGMAQGSLSQCKAQDLMFLYICTRRTGLWELWGPSCDPEQIQQKTEPGTGRDRQEWNLSKVWAGICPHPHPLLWLWLFESVRLGRSWH